MRKNRSHSGWIVVGRTETTVVRGCRRKLWVSQDGENIWGRGTGAAGIRAPAKRTKCRASAMTSSYSSNYFQPKL